MDWFKRLLSSTHRVTINDPLVIESPRIGFLNLIGPTAEALLEEDKSALGPLFASVEQCDRDPPDCEVLIIYCDVQTNGIIAGHSDNLRIIIRESNAPIVIVASENDAESYTAAAKRTGYGKANLVMTLERKGAGFTNFFTDLFRKMFAGQSMLLAWVELAPQTPGATHENCPATIFAAEVSHIVFKSAEQIVEP